ncbi:unnamed protein product, partial [Rotaria sp. Silwood2]
MKFQSDLFDVEHVYGSLECDETKQGECIKGYFHGTCDKKTQHSPNRLKLSGLV